MQKYRFIYSLDRLNEAASRLTPSPVFAVAGSAPPVLPTSQGGSDGSL